jgi:hypothetical protein
MISTVRGDEVPLISGWRIDAVANATMTVLGIIALIALWAFERGKAINRDPGEAGAGDAKDAKIL